MIRGKLNFNIRERKGRRADAYFALLPTRGPTAYRETLLRSATNWRHRIAPMLLLYTEN